MLKLTEENGNDLMKPTLQWQKRKKPFKSKNKVK